MRAMPLDQAVTSLLVAKQHQVFAEHFDRPDRPRSLQLIHQRRRLPVHPHQLSAGVLSPGAGDQVVRFLAHHGDALQNVRLLNEWPNYDMHRRYGKHNLRRSAQHDMPKLKRSEPEERATDFVESLDRGLRLLQKFGSAAGPITLSDLARAPDLPRATARRILFKLQQRGFIAANLKPLSP